MSKKNQGLQHRWKKEEVALLLGNDKDLSNDKKVIYLQGYLKSRINKLPRKNKLSVFC